MPLAIWNFVYQYLCIGGKWAVIWLPVFGTRYVYVRYEQMLHLDLCLKACLLNPFFTPFGDMHIWAD